MADVILLAELPELRVSRIAGTEMAQVRRENPAVKFGVLGHEEATLVFYAGGNVERFGSVDDLLKKVPFAPQGDPEKNPYVITIDEAMRDQLDQRGIEDGKIPRCDLLENLRSTDTIRIVGINPANVNLRNFKPVIVSVITNVISKSTIAPATTSSAPTTPTTQIETSPASRTP